MSKNKKDERKRDSITEKFDSRAYENYAESNEASLPVRGRKAGASEKTPATVQKYHPKPAKGSWVKFETWVRTRDRTSDAALTTPTNTVRRGMLPPPSRVASNKRAGQKR